MSCGHPVKCHGIHVRRCRGYGSHLHGCAHSLSLTELTSLITLTSLNCLCCGRPIALACEEARRPLQIIRHAALAALLLKVFVSILISVSVRVGAEPRFLKYWLCLRCYPPEPAAGTLLGSVNGAVCAVGDRWRRRTYPKVSGRCTTQRCGSGSAYAANVARARWESTGHITSAFRVAVHVRQDADRR